MIYPAPTTKIDPRLARGTFTGPEPATATRPALARVSFPNSSYELHLVPVSPISTAPGKRIIGTIHAKARRIDTVGSGGRYVEPVAGRPRRVQGVVISIDSGQVIVDAGVPIHCTPTDPRQAAEQFQAGQFVSFDVLDGATFTPQA